MMNGGFTFQRLIWGSCRLASSRRLCRVVGASLIGTDHAFPVALLEKKW